MSSAMRAFLGTLAAAGILGATAAAAWSTPTPIPPSSPVESCATNPSAVGQICARPDPTLSIPSRAERGTQVTVSGENWRCITAQVSPSWSGAVQTAMVDQGSFAVSLPVGASVEPGSYAVQVSCGGYSAAAPITIFAPRVEITTPTTTTRPPVTTRKPVTTEPTTAITTPPTGVETTGEQPSIAAQPVDIPEADTDIGGPLVVVLLIAVVVGAMLVAWWRRRVARTPREPHPPRVRVRVAADANPYLRVRELTGPAVRVRLSAGEPTVCVKEVSR